MTRLDLAAIRARAEAATYYGGDEQERAEDTLALLAEARRLQEEVESYRAAICFETTCTNCAHMLDRMAGLDAEVERLNARLASEVVVFSEYAPAHLARRTDEYRKRTHSAEAEMVRLRAERDALAAEVERLTCDEFCLYGRELNEARAQIERLRSAIRLISPDHITPHGASILNAALADPKEEA